MQAELQWSASVPDEEDTTRSHSRKRRRHERDHWRWQCRDWRGCGWEWKLSKQAREPPQNPARAQANAQDAVMQIGNPCLMEHTRQVESPTVPMPKAAPVGARLDSEVARQKRANKSCGRGRQHAHGGTAIMEETMAELEQANIAVESQRDQRQAWHDAIGTAEAAPGLPIDARNGHS